MPQKEREPKRVKTREEMEQSSSEQEKSEASDNQEDKSERNGGNNSEVNTTINGTDADEEKRHKKEIKKKGVSAVVKACIGDEKGAIEDAKAAKEEADDAKEEADDTEKDEDDEKDDVIENAKKAVKVAQALQTACKLFMTFQLMAWLKYMLMMLTKMIVAAANAIWGWIAGMAAKAWGMIKAGFAAATGFLAQTLGINTVVSGIILMFGGMGTITITGVAILNAAFGHHSTKHIAEKDAVIEIDCAEDTINSVSGSSITEDVDKNEKTNEHAQKVYSVLYAYGMSEENIAGVIGNFSAESEIDTYGIEGIYDEPFKIGPRKKEALKDVSAYSSKIGCADSSHYSDYDKKYYCGFGLAQWTAGRAYLLFQFAKKHGFEWYDIDCQTTYMIADDGDSNKFFKSWKPENTPEDAAVTICTKYELPGGYKTEKVQKPRRDAAASWFTKMQNGKLVLDKDYGESILAAAGTTAQAASDTATAEKSQTCNELYKMTVDNSSIVSAAISLCYPYSKFASGSVREKSDWGTKLYQEVNDAVHGIKKGDSGGLYRDCGRYVRTVLKWCGADKDYDDGDTASQYTYLLSSKKWKEIDWQGNYENLSPGDVLITRGKGHVCIYVGYEAIAAVYPDTPADEDIVICSASIDARTNGYPACCRDFYPNLSTFAAFRCVKPDNDTKYKNVGTNVSIDQAANGTSEKASETASPTKDTTKKKKSKKGKK